MYGAAHCWPRSLHAQHICAHAHILTHKPTHTPTHRTRESTHTLLTRTHAHTHTHTHKHTHTHERAKKRAKTHTHHLFVRSEGTILCRWCGQGEASVGGVGMASPYPHHVQRIGSPAILLPLHLRSDEAPLYLVCLCLRSPPILLPLHLHHLFVLAKCLHLL